MADVPVLIVIGGLPGTGKSTVAGVLVRQTRFAYLRVDRIEQAIMDAMRRITFGEEAAPCPARSTAGLSGERYRNHRGARHRRP